MSNALDNDFTKRKKDESFVNRFIGALRILLCGTLLVVAVLGLIHLVKEWGEKLEPTNLELSFVGLVCILFIGFCYYNYKLAKLEFTSKYVEPPFNSFWIICFIICSSFLVESFIMAPLKRIYYFGFISTSLLIILVYCIFLILIILREIQYLIRKIT